MGVLTLAAVPAEDQLFIDKIIRRRLGRPGALLGILEEVQAHHPQKYLPLDVLRYIATKTEITFSKIYSVATFYALFNLQPQGEHSICICRGTACHTRGSRNLLQSVLLDLNLELPADDGSNNADKILLTTADKKFTVRTVACFGQCALAPVVEVNHRICGHVSERTLQREIQAVRTGE
ncbi:MAG TPA: NAD(P)H-dependent oxidoreductase subunit E [Candidatus Limnocylindrales bacterium]|nr:NAD(P)H-dependent oxidoreductase subunit E [Candidatus Limnocylindrales bacterium]